MAAGQSVQSAPRPWAPAAAAAVGRGWGRWLGIAVATVTAVKGALGVALASSALALGGAGMALALGPICCALLLVPADQDGE